MRRLNNLFNDKASNRSSFRREREGCWERVVGLFKKHLAALALSDNVHVEMFNTILVQIEGIFNRQPLTAISAAAEDCEALTPSHILYPSFASHQSCIITPQFRRGQRET